MCYNININVQLYAALSIYFNHASHGPIFYKQNIPKPSLF